MADDAKNPAEQPVPTPVEPVEAPAAGTTASMEPRPAEVPAAPQAVPLPTESLAEAVAAEVAAAEVEGGTLPPAESGGFFNRMAESIRRRPARSALIAGLVLLFIGGFFFPVPPPHVALGGEQALPNGPWWLTNSLLLTFIVDVILIIVALATSARMKLVPSGVQNFMEAVIEYFYGLAEQIAGKAARNYFPWIMTIFLLVILSNWTGLIPGVGSIGWEETHASEEHQEEEQPAGETGMRLEGQLAMANGSLILLAPDAAAVESAPAAVPSAVPSAAPSSGLAAVFAAEEGEPHFIPILRAPSADLNLTLALAISTMFMVQVWGVRALGGSYFRKFFNFSGKGFMIGINVFVGLLELISEFARIISFGFRLFGNIFAGEIVLATMAFLGAFLLPVPFYILETFVGFVQALVFSMLALVFFSMATVSHGEHHEEHAAAH